MKGKLNVQPTRSIAGLTEKEWKLQLWTAKVYWFIRSFFDDFYHDEAITRLAADPDFLDAGK